MSMINISGIPNLGIPAMGSFPQSNPGQGLANAQASYADNNRFFGQQAATQAAAANMGSQQALYGPRGFGGDTALAAATGAAYGRGTGGFNAVGGVTQPVGSRSVFNTGTSPVPYQNAPGPGSFSPSPNYPGGRGSSVFDTGTSAVPYSPPPGSFSPSPNYPGSGRDQIAQAMMPPAPNFNDTFSQFRSGGDPTATQMQNQPAINAVNQMSLGGRFNPSVPPSSPPSPEELGTGGPTPGYTPDFQGPGDENSFANRFAAGNYFQPGKPSEYATSPYTDVRGQTHQPGAPPPGVSTPYSFDNPGGALGRGGFTGSQAQIMNASADDEPSGDTLTARDRAIGTGPAGTGGFYPSAFNPGQYQPSSPFGSGAGTGAGRGSVMPPTQTPFFGGEGSGFGAPGSMQQTGQHGFRGRLPALLGSGQDSYGNPFIQGSAPPFAQGASRMGGGLGLGGLDALGQGTVFRGRK